MTAHTYDHPDSLVMFPKAPLRNSQTVPVARTSRSCPLRFATFNDGIRVNSRQDLGEISLERCYFTLAKRYLRMHHLQIGVTAELWRSRRDYRWMVWDNQPTAHSSRFLVTIVHC
ncbi:hypothetical protein Y032_0026g1432 [Ancylostoma ceylanicum]|uniref:Uncharacterized protein n=1 Tax=Ancylostoma ceylanicum TaxID=53326 RepID=A0A016UVS3_9BILA|nr:hypothetical protein Y032_0026g1432 [Ancylostoma ceylanicum]